MTVSQISQPLVPLVDEFAGRLFGELDYIQEGHSCEKFAKLYAHVPRVRTPGIHWDATARRYIVNLVCLSVDVSARPSV